MGTQLKLEAPWEEVKEKLKEADTRITDEDLQFDPGDSDPLLRHLAKKMGRTVEEVKGWVESVAVNSGKAG